MNHFQGWLCEQMEDIPEEHVKNMVDTIHQVKEILLKARANHSSFE